MEGVRLWDPEARYDGIGADYCRKACGATRCETCPAPLLLPECAPIARAYLLVHTQWRIGMGGRSGLDYPACALAWNVHREDMQLPPDDELLSGVQIVENAFLAGDAEQRERREMTRGR